MTNCTVALLSGAGIVAAGREGGAVGGCLATFAGLHHHVGELLDFRGATHVVEDGEGLQVLRNTAGGGGRFGVQGVVQAQQLRKTEQKEVKVSGPPPPRLTARMCRELTELWAVSALRR